jgi:hypothetical protein
MPAPKTRASRRPAKKQGRAINARAEASRTKTANENEGLKKKAGKQQRLGQKVNHPPVRSSHKPAKSSRTVAEERGLAQRNAVISAKPAAASAVGTLAGAAGSIVDQQFSVWSSMVRMSPLPMLLHQQAVVAKLIMGFMLPSKSVR